MILFLLGYAWNLELSVIICLLMQTCLSMSQDIQAQRTKFQKPQVYYGALRIYGDNILTAEGESWKRFRKISAPVFTEVRARYSPSFEKRLLNEEIVAE